VDATPAARSDRPTTLAFVRLVDGQASYAFYDENTAGRMLEQDDIPDTPAEACFFGGISLVGEPCGATYEAMMLERADSAVTMIDPNIRRGFITDEAAYRGRLQRMLAAADIVKISDEDLEWIRGDHDGAALVNDRTSLVLLTRGAEGARVFTRDGQFDVPARRATVVDTVGAGDTFNAGVLAGLHEAGLLDRAALRAASEAQLRPAVALGAAAAAVTVSRAGANPPRRDEL
jgi:fructokinase